MSSAPDKSAGPSTTDMSPKSTTSVANTKNSEKALDDNVPRQTSSLNVHLTTFSSVSSPHLAADTSQARDLGTSVGNGGYASPSLSSANPPSPPVTSYTLGADNRDMLLQELMNITASAAPFLSSKAPSITTTDSNTMNGPATSSSSTAAAVTSWTRRAASPAQPPASASAIPQGQVGEERPTVKESTVKPKSLSASKSESQTNSGNAATATAKEKTNQNPLTSKDEQDILDAILASIDGQQSSVSGDLTGLNNAPNTASPLGNQAAEGRRNHSQQQQVEEGDENDEEDAVDRVLEEAKLLASSTVLCETQRGELVLHIHEHVALRRQVTELSKTVGAPTCVALAEVAAASRGNIASASFPASRLIAVAIGTNLGVVVLFDQRWTLLGLCGSVEANVVNARGAVVSLSLSTTATSTNNTSEGLTAATGHAKGVFILWSLHNLSPLRIIRDESTVPLLRVQHLHRDPARVLVLESSGAVKLFQFWKVMSKHMLRSTTITTASEVTPISDVDTLPFPSTFYLRHLARLKENLSSETGGSSDSNDNSNSDSTNGIPWLCAPPPLPPATATAAGVSRTAWSTVPDTHLVAAVSNDTVLVYVVEAGLQGAVSGVARHTHPPSSALNNELIRFVAMEQDGAVPRVLLCVSWNTEIELLHLNLQMPDTAAGGTPNDSAARHPFAQGVERIALLRMAAPLQQMVPLAVGNMLLLDQKNDAQLMDVSVAVMVERHHFPALEYLSFSSRLCGMKYNGTVTSNQTTALLVGKKHIYGISVYSWRMRLSKLVGRRKFAEALDLAKGFAEDVALSMVGLSSNAAQRRRELHQYMEHILLAYLENSLPGNNSTSGNGGASSPASSFPPVTGTTAGAASLLDVLQHVVSYCCTVDALDLLYGPITRTLQQRGLLPHLLYVMERTMLRGAITYMPEPLIARFINLFLQQDERMAVEEALGVRRQPSTVSPTNGNAAALPLNTTAGAINSLGPADDGLCGKARAELALMYLDTNLPNLLRLAQEHGLLRLSVAIMSYRQKKYVEALAYALDVEENECLRESSKHTSVLNLSSGPSTSASVAVDLVEYTLKDSALLPGAEIPASEQRPVKKALLEYLLQTNAQGQSNLLRFLRRQPQHAVRVLLFALSDEGPCSPWSSSADGFCRTQFVSSVYFILTGGTRTQPRLPNTVNEEQVLGRQHGRNYSGGKALNLFLVSDEELSRMPGLRKLCAAELAQRSFPPYEAVHTFLSNAALFNELFLADGKTATASGSGGGGSGGVSFNKIQYEESPLPHPSSPLSARVATTTVRFDVWVDLVIQDGLFTFQSADTAEQRRTLQEELIHIMMPPFIRKERVAVFQPDFTRLRMARCLAALLCKEQRYPEAIQCYIDPVQNRIDPSLQRDVFAMLRGEMQRLQDLKTHTANAAAQQQLNASCRFDSNGFVEGYNASTEPVSPSSEGPTAAGLLRGAELGRNTFNTSFIPILSTSSAAAVTAAPASANELDAAIKALQRGVMSQVEALVLIDATALAQFIFDYLPSNHLEVMRLLRDSSAAFLDYLDELMAQGDPAVASDINLQNTYIELLCAHAPERVLAHLQVKGSAITYDVQQALRAVRKYRIADATIYLLEKTMMIEEAMAVMLNATRAALAEVREEVITRATALKTNINSNAMLTSTTTAATIVAAAQKWKGTMHSEAAGAFPDFLAGTSAVPAAPGLLRLVSIGEALCQKYQADRRFDYSNNNGGGGSATGADHVGGPHMQNPEYWFRLLDVFMVPRRLLCEVVMQDEQMQSAAAGSGGDGGSNSRNTNVNNDAVVDGTGMPSELEIAAHWLVSSRSSSPRGSRDGRYSPSSPVLDNAAYRLPFLKQPLTQSQRQVIAALVSVYTQCTSDVLRAMMSSLDLAVVVNKVVQDNKGESFHPFKPIILDMMASLSFDLEARRLCESVTESDVMSLGRELYQKLNTGIVTLSDCCALCHLHLSEPPSAATVEITSFASLTNPAVAAAASSVSSSTVCVYTCGHAYHTLCCLRIMGPLALRQGGCYVCAHQRFPSRQPDSGDDWRRGSMRNPTAGGVETIAAKTSSGQPAATSAAAGVAAATQSPSVNVARMQRRIRQTKIRIDHTEDLYPLLKSYLTWGDSAPSTPAEDDKATAAREGSGAAPADGGSWVLAPSPRVPAAIGALATSGPVGALVAATTNSTEEAKGLEIETLTDAEILELFGGM